MTTIIVNLEGVTLEDLVKLPTNGYIKIWNELQKGRPISFEENSEVMEYLINAFFRIGQVIKADLTSSFQCIIPLTIEEISSIQMGSYGIHWSHSNLLIFSAVIKGKKYEGFKIVDEEDIIEFNMLVTTMGFPYKFEIPSNGEDKEFIEIANRTDILKYFQLSEITQEYLEYIKENLTDDVYGLFPIL